MSGVLTTVFCVLLVELALRLPFGAVVASLGESGGKALHVVRATSISDHWKEKALGAYARVTFVSSLKLAAMLAILIAAAAVLVMAGERIAGGFQEFILGWRGIASSLVVASLYLAARKAVLRGHV